MCTPFQAVIRKAFAGLLARPKIVEGLRYRYLLRSSKEEKHRKGLEKLL
jgi:hypothetical protein